MARAPLALKWDELMPAASGEAAPPELEVVSSSAGGGEVLQGEQGVMAEFSNQYLQDRIARVQKQISSGISSRLPDKGERLLAMLRQCQEELHRRTLACAASSQKDMGRCNRPVQSRNADSLVSVKDSFANHSPMESNLHSSFAFHFNQRLNGKRDVAPTDDTTITSWDMCRNYSENDIKVPEERERTKLCSQSGSMSSRDFSFKSIGSIANKERSVSANDDCRDSDVSSISQHARKIFSTLSDKRKRTFDAGDLVRSKKKSAQEVVLLDEVQPPQPIEAEVSDKWKELKIYYPSREHPECVELSHADIKCLDPESYLSSPVMNFYIMYLQGLVPPISRQRGDYHFFNTYFYNKLEEAVSLKGDRDACFPKLRRWWKGVNIFQKAYILLPIHRDMHWSLVIICIPAQEDGSGAIVLHLDSLGFHSSGLIFDVVEK